MSDPLPVLICPYLSACRRIGGGLVDALRLADSYLRSGTQYRRPEVALIAAEIGFEEGICGLALPWFAEVEPKEASASVLLMAADCVEGEDPEAARQLLIIAAAHPGDDATRALILRRLLQE
ncbi:MAG: hypothetical protein ACI8RZ_001261 [Myxococcota bacterium]